MAETIKNIIDVILAWVWLSQNRVSEVVYSAYKCFFRLHISNKNNNFLRFSWDFEGIKTRVGWIDP